ncbi:hypothetical protein ACTI_44750 [Actinoplanes sp. OR16]|uniref:CPCC family cysteine-rich protein n=1 Tax=Actinoplanes sp. OR16 TaxID=946334 RepID=UPI000F6F868F|nr:CPCC family cysteine-rich protein [Actinoplanes sp. OR16]BBH67790.1 hypothetical protein ACTI_44750 [Actinoplanes sp. OR16]
MQPDPVIRGPHDDPSVSDDELVRRRSEWFEAYTSRQNVFAPVSDVSYTCPCCGHATLSERGGYEICSECSWEDDGQDEHDSFIIRGGPNGRQSLDDARAEYISKGGTPQPHLPPTEPI